MIDFLMYPNSHPWVLFRWKRRRYRSTGCCARKFQNRRPSIVQTTSTVSRGFDLGAFLPDDIAAALRRRVREIGGVALIGVALIATAALASWSVKDPSLSYATGAPVRFSDREPIEQIVEAAQACDFGVRTLVHAIVQSESDDRIQHWMSFLFTRSWRPILRVSKARFIGRRVKGFSGLHCWALWGRCLPLRLSPSGAIA